MAAPDTFLTLLPRVTPRWMKRAKVRALVSQLYVQADLVVDRLAGAISARCVELAPDDALGAIGGTCALSRAPGESDASLRAYLRDPWSRWYKAGTNLGLLTELEHLGFPGAKIITYWDIVDSGVDPLVAFGGNTSFFFVTLPYTGAFTPVANWNGGDQWNGGPLWGLSGDRQLLAAVQDAIAKWKPADTSCRFVAVGLDAAFAWAVPVWGTSIWGAFTWGAGFLLGTYSVVPCIEPWELDSMGAQRREYFNYSFLQERVT